MGLPFHSFPPMHLPPMAGAMWALGGLVPGMHHHSTSGPAATGTDVGSNGAPRALPSQNVAAAQNAHG